MNDQVTTIARSKARRYAAVSINLRNRDIVGFVDEAKSKVASELDLPPGYFAEWGGQFKNLASARRRLLIIIPLVLVVIFFILQRLFRSVKQTLLVFQQHSVCHYRRGFHALDSRYSAFRFGRNRLSSLSPGSRFWTVWCW